MAVLPLASRANALGSRDVAGFLDCALRGDAIGERQALDGNRLQVKKLGKESCGNHSSRFHGCRRRLENKGSPS